MLMMLLLMLLYSLNDDDGVCLMAMINVSALSSTTPGRYRRTFQDLNQMHLKTISGMVS